jgi:hypothetical protein
MTPTTSVTATQTMTPTASETPTQTPSPTPTKPAIFAYIFIDQSGIGSTGPLSSWMVSQGSTWKGFNTVPTAPSTVQSTFDAQMNAYLSYSGWTAGTEPSVIKSPISTTSGGFDAYGNAIVAYTFQTVQIPVGQFSATSWLTVFVSTGATNGQKYSTVKNGTSPGGMFARTMNNTYNSLIINYSGSTNLPAGTYRMYSTYSSTSFQLSTGLLPNYFQGGTLV